MSDRFRLRRAKTRTGELWWYQSDWANGVSRNVLLLRLFPLKQCLFKTWLFGMGPLPGLWYCCLQLFSRAAHPNNFTLDTPLGPQKYPRRVWSRSDERLPWNEGQTYKDYSSYGWIIILGSLTLRLGCDICSPAFGPTTAIELLAITLKYTKQGWGFDCHAPSIIYFRKIINDY